MLRRDLLRALLASPLTGWLRPSLWASLIGPADDVTNAADLYRMAFAWSEGMEPEARDRLFEAASASIDDPNVRVLIRKARPVLDALRKATSISDCRWGNEPLTADDLHQGHLHILNINNSIRILCLSARRLARMGKGRECLNDLFAGLTLAHRVGTGGPFIARLLECNGEREAFQGLGRILPELDREALDDLSLRLDALPAPEPASATIGPESRYFLGLLRAAFLEEGPKLELRDLAELGFDAADAETLDQLTGCATVELLAHLDATGPALVELARRLDLPRPECRPALDEFIEAERSTHPIAARMAEYAWGVRHVVDRMRALRSMLRAGLALVRDGEAAFLTVPDPFGSGAFVLERRGDGFLIRSEWKDEGQREISLQIGDAA